MDFLEVAACVRRVEIRLPVGEQWIVPRKTFLVRDGCYITVAHQDLQPSQNVWMRLSRGFIENLEYEPVVSNRGSDLLLGQNRILKSELRITYQHEFDPVCHLDYTMDWFRIQYCE